VSCINYQVWWSFCNEMDIMSYLFIICNNNTRISRIACRCKLWRFNYRMNMGRIFGTRSIVTESASRYFLTKRCKSMWIVLSSKLSQKASLSSQHKNLMHKALPFHLSFAFLKPVKSCKNTRIAVVLRNVGQVGNLLSLKDDYFGGCGDNRICSGEFPIE